MPLLRSCCSYLSLCTGCILIGILLILLHPIKFALNHNSSSAQIFLCLLGIIIAVALIYGALKESQIYLWLWVVGQIITTFIFTLGCLPGSQYCNAHPEIVISPIIIIIIDVISIFCMFVVYSYIRELDEKDEQVKTLAQFLFIANTMEIQKVPQSNLHIVNMQL